MKTLDWPRPLLVLVVLSLFGTLSACGKPAAPTGAPRSAATTGPTRRPAQPTTSPSVSAPTSPAEPAAIIVDNNDPGFAIEAGEWGHCFDGDCGGRPWGQDFLYADPACGTCRARFRFEVRDTGDYDVWTWWPQGDDRATDTLITVEYHGGTLTMELDQSGGGNEWVWLASVYYEAGEAGSVVVQGNASGYANADAVALTPAGSGPPSGGEAGEARAPVPVVQYYYAETSNVPRCYYLHWDVANATAVWVDGNEVQAVASTEVCPEESREYVLRAENSAGAVEEVVTLEVAEATAEPQPASPEPERATATPFVAPTAAAGAPPGGYRRIIFLHHSCGANLIEQGGVRERFTALGYEFYDHGYNADGLVLADGTWTGQNFDVPDDNTDPDGYAAIFAQPLHSPPDNSFSHLMQYDVIAFKSCFPVSNIGSNEQLAQYKAYYRSIRARMDEYPNKIFVVVTQPPQVAANTNAQEAARARAFTQWLASDEFLAGYPNVFTFDFFGLLADPRTNMLRREYTGNPSDAHPNERANREIAPLFVDFVHRAIQTYAAR